jgi:hypothetical protein
MLERHRIDIEIKSRNFIYETRPAVGTRINRDLLMGKVKGDVVFVRRDIGRIRSWRTFDAPRAVIDSLIVGTLYLM